MFMDDEFSSSILSVNVLGVEKVNTMMMISNDQFSLKFGNSIPLSRPMEFELYHKPMTDISARKCVYWDFERSAWAEDGCYPISGQVRDESQCSSLTDLLIVCPQLHRVPV